jgi:hypothetical protein
LCRNVGRGRRRSSDWTGIGRNDGEAVVEATKWLGLGIIGWISAGLTAAFGIGTLYFRDIRLAIPTVLMAVVTAFVVNAGL